MALKTDIRGMIWRYPDYFVVGREQAREYARAVKCDHPAFFDEAAAADLGYDAIVAPLTLVTIFAKYVQLDFFRHVDLGMEDLVIVQVEQRFVWYKPILAGDKLWARMEVDSVNERFGADIVVTRNICTNEGGEVVMEASTTLMGQYRDREATKDDAIQLRWDPESGQVVRTV
ncbi:MAG: (3R)-hydroxyacyl-ACP dehydratase subunit HadC [Mycobacterium sp.]|uniref:(3R)-hydroxyacyl-ACP dehydratase subunit HadC n=1 Tax=Mycobacterium sp. TaxID=1785 RepID=UPI001ECBE420|nr:(3R)-hydroxyacyl-ACP dehydratase subunit HadC [Mycobacterium sp.]MBV8785294.1 (3R)-hydroxyacyl-ACP dehydratase subunit HadC [Mycobacterium sp.]